MAKTLGFSVSSPANLSQALYLRFLSGSFRGSKCPTVYELRLRAVKPGISVFCPEICRSISSTARALDSDRDADSLVGELARDFNPGVSAAEAQESSVDTGWDLGVTRLEESEPAKQGFRVFDTCSPIDMESSAVKSFEEFMKSGVHETSLSHVEKAWDHWNKLGAPKLIVAPMMDQSELPFRMLCRRYGATGAYTPMFHSRPFAFQAGYRRIEFTTCPEDRPLFVQFGANDPELLLKAAMFVQEHCDYVDINLGCPQRVAKRGRYGAFLMDDLPLIESMVHELATGLSTPVSCKIRLFPDLEDTVAYARMLESAGCSLLAVHGRTRDQKDGRATRADWEAIKAVKNAVRIPVLANGNIRWLEDVHECIRMTGVDGVMSAESLLENPALFGGHRMKPVEAVTGNFEELSREGASNELSLTLEYLDLCEKYPVAKKMIRAHVYKLLVGWFHRYPELRDEMNGEQGASIDWIRANSLLGPSNEQTTAVVPEVIRDGESSSGVADVESLSPKSKRSPFAGMWLRSLHVKITGKDGASKLDIQIPAGFIEGLSNTIPAVAGLDLRQIREEALVGLGSKLESGSILADFNGPAGDHI